MRHGIKLAVALAAAACVIGSAPAGATVLTDGPITTSTPIGATATDFTGTLTFAAFNSSLGLLQSVTLDLSSSLSTTVTVTNAGGAASSGTAKTELLVTVLDPTSQDSGQNPLFDLLSPAYSYSLASGGTSSSGLLTKSGTAEAIITTGLSEFLSGPVDFSVATFTQTVLSNTGGNTAASQVTSASATGTITYNYTPSSELPEPMSMALLATGMVGLGFMRRRSS